MGHHEIPDQETGRVISIDNEYVFVELDSKDACHTCAAKALCRPNDDGSARQMKVLNTVNAQADDCVSIITNDKNMTMFVFMQYGLPLIGFMVGIFLGYFAMNDILVKIPQEIKSFLSGLIIMFLMGMITRKWSYKQAEQKTIYYKTGEIVNS